MPSTPPDQPGVRIEVQSPYEAGTKTWSNRWFFNGPDWENEAEFEDVADALKDMMVGYWLTDVHTVIAAIGTNGGSDVPVYTKAYSAAGTFAEGTGQRTPLESVGLARFTTTQRSTKNHPIYGFKYLHGALMDADSTPEKLYAFQKSQIGSQLSDLLDGIVTASHTRKPCTPGGAVFQDVLVEIYMSHRDFLK